MKFLTTTAIAATLAAGPVLAEEHSNAEMSGDQTETAQTETMDSSGMDGAETAADPLIVTVGTTEITASDVTAAVQSLPPQMQQRPAEQLIPFVVDQLVLRELILMDAARTNGQSAESEQQANAADSSDSTGDETEMASDDSAGSTEMSDDTTDMAASDSSGAQSGQGMQDENATIEAYVSDRMEGVVTDEAVQRVYDEAAANSDAELPPLEQVRPQIEQQLRAEEIASLRDELEEGVEIVFYGPDGQPREATTADQG
ncbi:hypothetical protein SAMN04488012_103203 [Palleronia salina]|uniref:Uncharacterized protein n=1 Tax=Palleronia salina TaxID=313368 RepID=A0A1M6ESK7_9RHOB|nr:hypothetical protein [Palleronia salina]SHI88385.1 hypothetical protein SAMN04488012_103203 [Palleronia salina]